MTPHVPWRQWLPDFVLLALLWGSSFLFMREGAHAFGPFATAFVRIFLGAVLLTPLVIWRGDLHWLGKQWGRLLLSGALNSAVPFACYGYALLSITTGMSSILNATTPLFGALVARWWLGDRLQGWQMLGLGLGFAGVAALASDMPGGISFDAGGHGLAVLACLLATLCYGLAGSLTKRHLHHLPALVTATGSLWGASVLLSPLAWWTWPAEAPSGSAWAALVMAGVFSTALAYVLYFRLLSRTGPARAMTVTYLIPVFANLIGVVVLDEVITPWMLACGGLIVLGTALASGLVTPRRPS